jgi:MYXO-CTERM domain-containing protein
VWSGTSDATATIRSSIVTGQRDHGVIASFPSIRTSVVHSNVWGNGVDYLNASPGTGTISANPLYVSATDLRLQPSSLCIDTAAAGAIDHDILGMPRPLDGDGIGAIASDMGAYEYVPPGSPSPDAGVPDAATPDAAVPDAATPDAGVDAGAPDAATPGPDAGAPDAGTEPPADGSCSAGGGGAGAGGLIIALAALAAARRRRRVA